MPEVVYSRLARADMIIERFERRVSMLADHPELGPARPEIAEGARALVSERWLVLYRVDAEFVRVVRVVDGARDLRHIDWTSAG